MTSAEIVAQELRNLAGTERRIVARFLASLERFDRLQLFLGLGYSSTYSFCVASLKLSECSAYSRIEIARLSRRFPKLIGLLESGALTLTTAGLLAPHLTHENFERLTAHAGGKSKREVQRILACLGGTSAPRVRLTLMISLETEERLHEARNLLRHVVPNGDVAEIFDRSLKSLIRDLRRVKFAEVDAPRSRPGRPPRGRQIPADVRRAVEARDGRQCAFEGSEGRCKERGFLEFHHLRPFASGGKATVANIELRCRAHNAYEARLDFNRLGPDPVSTGDPQAADADSAP